MREGSIFHRIVEAIQRGMEPEAAIFDGAASTTCAEWVRRWVVAWPEPALAAELKIAIDADGFLVEWDSPRAWLRGIIDRLDWGTEPGHLLVTDWKSGWSGWTGVQAECYALLAVAWARAQGFPVESVTCRVWSPTAVGFRCWHDWAAEDLPWDAVQAQMDAADRLEARPEDEEIPGGGCARCNRRDKCKAWAALELAEPGPIEEAARAYLACKAKVAALESRLKAHVEETGRSVGGCGFVGRETPILDGVGILSDLLAPFGLTQPDVPLALLKIFNVSKTTAMKIGRTVKPRDRAGQTTWLESRTKAIEVNPVWSTSIGAEEESDE